MIPLPIVGAIIEGVTKLADDLITTDEEKGKLDLQRRALDIEAQKLDVSLLQGQADINREEAKHGSMFVAGARPFIIWVGGVALAMVYIPRALVMTGMWAYQAWATVQGWSPPAPVPELPLYPDLGVTDLIGLLGAMLGFGAMRSIEKVKGVATQEVRK